MIDEKDDVSPDSLMADFRGKGLVPILILTVVVHLVVFGGTSVGYLKDELMGPATDEMSQEEKVDAAVKEATIAIREIAEKYGLSAQDVSDQFSKGGSRTSKIAGSNEEDEPADASPTSTAPSPPTVPEDAPPKSDYEKTLETVTPPPAAPDLAAPITDEESLF